MRWLTALLPLLLVGGSTGPEGPGGDRAKVQGAWTCVAMERNGAPLPPERYRDGRLVMEGDQFTYYQEGRVLTQGLRKLDPGHRPRWVDDTHSAGPLKGKTYLGIYELEGDTFRTCNGSAGQARPTEFATRPASGLLLITFKREKAKPGP
jgi:uncharacterized protein (TIGR03067 family)